MTGRLDGLVTVITGASSGIGQATARRFIADGAVVVIADVQDAPGRALADELGDRASFRPHRCHQRTVGQLDHRSRDRPIRSAGRDVQQRRSDRRGRRIANTSAADFDFTTAVLFRGTFLGAKHAARVMMPQRSGLIVSTTSPAAVVGGLGPHIYGACKASVIGLTNSVAAELRPFGIRVNAVMPGATVTAMTADLVTGSADNLDAAHAAIAASSATPRPLIGDDIAAGVAYLASADGELVTATTLVIDGGLTGAPGSSDFEPTASSARPSFARAADGGSVRAADRLTRREEDQP